VKQQAWRTSGLILAGVLVLLAGAPRRAAAHGEGVLRLASRQLSAGDSVRAVGEKFGGKTTLTLALVGVDGRVILGEVRSDSAGAFAQYVRIPSDARPGVYRFVVIAADGDEVATLDVAVSPMRSAPAEEVEYDRNEIAAPTAEPLELDRARHPAVTGGAVALMVLALMLGGALLRRPTETP
jgi:hypothetical protein